MNKLLFLSLLLICLSHAMPLVGLKKATETPSAPSQDIRLRVISNGDITQEGSNCLEVTELQAGDVIVADADYQYVWLSLSCFKDETLLFLPHGQFEFVVPDITVAYPQQAFKNKLTVKARVATPQDLQARRNLACNPFDFRYRDEVGPATEKLAADSPVVSSGECRAYPHAYANRVTRNEHIFHPRNAIDGILTAGRGHSAFPYQSWGYGQHNDSEFVLYFGRDVTVDTISLVLRADYSGKKEHDTWWQSATIVFSDGTEEIIQPQRGGDLQSFPVKPRRTDSIRLKNLVRAMRDNSENWAALVELQVWGTETTQTQNPAAPKVGFKIDAMNSAPLVTTKAYKAADVAAVIRNVFEFAKQHVRADGRGWEDGVFHVGNMDAFLTTGDWRHYLYSRHVAECHRYKVNGGNPTTNGDNYCIGQSYITLAQLAPRLDKLISIIACADFNLKKGAVDYHWVDAIFMSAQVYTQLARLVGTPEYIGCELDSYRNWRSKLFNVADGFWYRDLRFVNKHTPQGRPIYWARGNAWAFAALARQLVFLPDRQAEAYSLYLKDFRHMAQSLKNCQRADGTWNASLADPLHFGGMETTGTAGFLYGFAIGVQYGLLDQDAYLPVVHKAYQALTTICQLAPGHIGYMQQASDAPNNYRSEAAAQKLTNRFGIGLFLLAASAAMRMCDDYQPPLLTIPLDYQSLEPSFLRPAPGFYRGKITVTSNKPFQEGNSPDKLCDGKWSDDNGARWSTQEWPAAVTFDFQKPLQLAKIAIVPYRQRNYAFTLETSDDGAVWKTVLDATKPARSVTIQYHDLPAQTARYARLTVKKVPRCFNGPWISLNEVCFYTAK